jgi:nucleotide-binding universal stress UspA family protein
MMQPFKSILVDVDATATAHPALDRGIRLAQRTGATVTIVDVMKFSHLGSYLPSGLEEDIVRNQRQQLARIADGVRGDVRAESKLLVGRPAIALIQEILSSGHDLLMRSHARDLTTPGPKPFGAVDMELLRKCPCPVLLARHGKPAPDPQIVGAVNASTDDLDEQALNARIVGLTRLMASRLDAAPPRLLHAWVPVAERKVRRHSTEEQFAAYVEEARQRAAAGLSRLVRSGEGRMQPLLRRGEADEVIPSFVVAEGVDLLVMGTVARSGISGMLIGNTAERILRKLPCSVLAVKPAGFVSPVHLDVP